MAAPGFRGQQLMPPLTLRRSRGDESSEADDDELSKRRPSGVASPLTASH